MTTADTFPGETDVHPEKQLRMAASLSMSDNAAFDLSRTAQETASKPPLATAIVLGLAGTKLAAHLLALAFTPYAIHRDEFLYLAMGKYLQLWRMDFPPAIAVLANTTRWLFGDNLFAIRIFPALAGVALVILAALMVRELGGRKLAQTLAAVAVLLNPLFLRSAALFQPVVLDQLWWTLGLYFLLRLAQSQKTSCWILIGAVCGIGLLTKFSVLFFGIGLFVGMLLSPYRKLLATPWPYAALLIALVLGSPSLVGQWRLDFPVLGQMRDLQDVQLSRVTPPTFLFAQVMMLGPAVILAGLGVVYLLLTKLTQRFRVLGWTCLASFVIVLLLQGKAYYVGPLYPLLLGAGATALGAFQRRYRTTAFVVMFALVAGYGFLTLPFGLPILPPERMARYAADLGMSEATMTNTGEVLRLPQDYADMLGWEDQVSVLAQTYHSLPPDKKAVAVIMARNYGEAGAIDFYGPRHDMPRAVCFVGSYWFFGPGDLPGNVVVSIGLSPEELQGHFKSTTVVAQVDHPWAVPEERNLPVMISEEPRESLQDIWPRLAGIN